MENICTKQGKTKIAGVAILISNIIAFDLNKQISDRHEHYLLIKGTPDKGVLTLINIYTKC